jgi:hypothetical protein
VMDNLRIESFTILQLLEDPEALLRYDDPSGYVTGCTPEWTGKLRDNPAATDNDLVMIAAIDGKTVVGRLGLIAGRVHVQGKLLNTHWLSGFFLMDAYKPSGIGAFMILKAINHSQCLMLSGAPRQDARDLYQKVGFVELGPLRRMVYVFRPRVVFERYLKNTVLAAAAGTLATPLAMVYYNTGRRGPQTQLSFISVKHFAPDLDTLLQGRTENHFPRDASTLNWALGITSGMRAFELRQHGRLRGYCILRIRQEGPSGPPHNLPPMSVCSILDYYIELSTEADLRAVLDFGIRHGRRNGADVLEWQINNSNAAKVCSERRLRWLGGDRVMLRAPRNISPSGEWNLTQAEGDVLLW